MCAIRAPIRPDQALQYRGTCDPSPPDSLHQRMSRSPSQSLYHLIPEAELSACKKEKRDYFPKSYAQDHFTHLTAKPELLLGVANHFYQQSSGNWYLLVLDATKLRSQVKYEQAAAVGDTPAKVPQSGQSPEIFPHLYGGINLDAIAQELAVERDSSGLFTSIQGF